MTASHRSVETAAVGVAALLAAALSVRLAGALDHAAAWGAASAGAVLAYVAADLVSGVVHWGFDRVVDERTPYLGPNFVRPFREHHADPSAITRHDFVELNGNTCIAVVPVLAAVFAGIDPGAGPAALFGVAFSLLLSFFTVMTNQIHQWAHRVEVPAAVAALQRWHLILAPGHHEVHHRPPFDRRFCITSGLLNPLLDRARLFALLEWLLRRPRPLRRPVRG